MLVRRATPDDAEAWAAVLAAVAQEGRWIGTQAPVDVAAVAERTRTTIADGADVLWVLEDDDGAVVGTLDLRAGRTEGVMTLGMCILEHARGRGGGHLFMRTALAWARSHPLHKLALEAWPDNDRAIALYEAYGFEREGLLRDHYRRRDGSLRSSVVMGLLLGDPQSRSPDGT